MNTGDKLLALIERFVAIDIHDFGGWDKVADFQNEARALLAEPPLNRSECMAKARAAAVAKRRIEMEERHGQVMPTVLKLKGEGRTLREIADALNGMGFIPDRAKRYSHSVIALMLNRYWENRHEQETQRGAAK